MSYAVKISRSAEQDLRDIYEYIAGDLLSPKNALGQIKRLEKAIISLNNMPNRYRQYESPRLSDCGLRVAPVDNFCIFYRCDDDSHVVWIIRIIYGRRDIPNLLSINDTHV